MIERLGRILAGGKQAIDGTYDRPEIEERLLYLEARLDVIAARIEALEAQDRVTPQV